MGWIGVEAFIVQGSVFPVVSDLEAEAVRRHRVWAREDCVLCSSSSFSLQIHPSFLLRPAPTPLLKAELQRQIFILGYADWTCLPFRAFHPPFSPSLPLTRAEFPPDSESDR
mmetsp:Transcript_42530/g.83844  ORF Transcript_42530/g.83844 Transcript_42530/m.83844 type:complete len:112 (+) Transcript_42530:1762-2097(+)